ncbi:ATP-binding protein [Streptomyces luteireticuli]|uniref:Histidine kinase/HSP90-like ATPase domain-containing protein n=1 Tax=Streptomyces luteireticuli TaxID=173858 RepID=A0ABP3IFH2_9ACTN
MISRVNKHCSVELQALPQRIGQVRRIVSAQLRYWHLDPLIDPAALGVTELLTNVHQHTGPDKRCTVEITLVLDRLTVSVRDHDPRVPCVGAADGGSLHGRGLALVAALSASWGVQRRADGGKAVWFTLRVPAAADVWGERAGGTAVAFEPAVVAPVPVVRERTPV